MSCGFTYDGENGGGGGIPDAPNDGNRYGRQSESWTQIDSIDNAIGTVSLDANGNVGIGTATPTDYATPGFRVAQLDAATLAEFIISLGGGRVGSLLATALGFVLSSDNDSLFMAANTNNQLNLLSTGEVQIPNLLESTYDFGLVWDSANGEVRRSPYTSQQLGQIQRVTNGTVSYHDTIADALSGAIPGDTVFVPVGAYTESVTVPASVSLVGLGGENSVRISGAAPASGARITLSAGAECKNLVVVTATNSDAAIVFAGDSVVCRDIRMIGAGASSVGFAPGASKNSLVKGLYTAGTYDTEFDCNGACTIFVRDFVDSSTANTTFDISDPTAYVVISSLKNHPSAVLTSNIKIDAAARFYIEKSLLNEGVSYPVELTSNSDGCKLEFNSCLLQGSSFDWFVDPGAAGTGTDISMNASEARLERIFAPQSWLDAIDPAIFVLDKGANDDRGFLFMGQIAVGTPGRGFESSFGEGDSSTLGMYVYTSDGTFTNFNDVTVAAAVDDTNTFTFEDVTAGHCIVFGNEGRKFTGLKSSLTVAGAPGAGEIVFEYWNGLAWTEWDVSAQGGSVATGFVHRSNDFWQNTGDEQVRVDPPADWAQVEIKLAPADPSGITAYWLRARIDTAVTTAPVFRRTKLGTNRIEIESTGILNKFGSAESKEQLLWHRRLEDDESGSSPGNATINYSPSIGLTMVDNNFQNGANDANGGVFQLPEGLDTGRPLRFELRWKPQSNNAGDVEWQFTHTRARLTDILNGTLPEDTQATIVSLNNQQNEYLETEFEIRVADFSPADELAFVYRRDATAGNLNDTYESNVQIVSTKIFGYKWD